MRAGTPRVGSRIGEILAELGIKPADLSSVAKDLIQLSAWAMPVPQLTSDSAQSKESAEAVKQTVLAWPLEATATRAQKTMAKLEDPSDQLLSRLLNQEPSNPDTGGSDQSVSNTGATPRFARDRGARRNIPRRQAKPAFARGGRAGAEGTR